MSDITISFIVGYIFLLYTCYQQTGTFSVDRLFDTLPYPTNRVVNILYLVTTGLLNYILYLEALGPELGKMAYACVISTLVVAADGLTVMGISTP